MVCVEIRCCKRLLSRYNRRRTIIRRVSLSLFASPSLAVCLDCAIIMITYSIDNLSWYTKEVWCVVRATEYWDICFRLPEIHMVNTYMPGIVRLNALHTQQRIWLSPQLRIIVSAKRECMIEQYSNIYVILSTFAVSLQEIKRSYGKTEPIC